MTKGKENVRLRRLLQFFLIIAILLTCGIMFGSRTQAAGTEGRVLFISSYSYAWEMVPMQIEGIQEVLPADVVLDYEFMDTKRVDDENSLQMFHDGLKYRLEHVEPYDVVILGDDAALRFAMEYQDELFAGIPLVFEAVNDEELIAQAAADPLITGIPEMLSMEKNIEFGLAINPKATRVVAILDDTLTGEAERQRFYGVADQFPQLEFNEINTSVLSTNKLRQEIRSVYEDSILIYVVMTEDADGRQYNNQEAVALLVDTARVPVLRMVEGGIGQGLLGGNVVSMSESGRQAAQIAMDIINGADITEMDLVLDSPNTYCVDVEIMDKFNISLSILPDDATLINYQGNILERHRDVLIPAVIILIVLLIVIAVLTIDSLRRRKLLHQLENARKTIETASQHDFLTGISNRSKFMSDLTSLLEQQTPCSVFMIDIDDFKHINDSMGHTAGDEALQQVAARLRDMGSELLTPYRFAGDEFIMILRSTQEKIVEKTAYQCRQVFAKPFILDKKKTKICGSIGIASYPDDTQDMEELIVFADDAMYQVKKNGKNDFAIYSKTIK